MKIPHPGHRLGRRSKPARPASGTGSGSRSSIELRRNAQSIYQDLVEAFGFTHRYNSVKRFVRSLKVREPDRLDVLESVRIPAIVNSKSSDGEQCVEPATGGRVSTSGVVGGDVIPRKFGVERRIGRERHHSVLCRSFLHLVPRPDIGAAGSLMPRTKRLAYQERLGARAPQSTARIASDRTDRHC